MSTPQSSETRQQAALMPLTIFTEGGVRNRALEIWGATAAAGSTSRVLLGGLLTNYLGWRWVLFVNVPICLITVVLRSRVLKGNRSDDNISSQGFDLAGAITFGRLRQRDYIGSDGVCVCDRGRNRIWVGFITDALFTGNFTLTNCQFHLD
jgi:MFS family permease